MVDAQAAAPGAFPVFPENCRSLLKKYLTHDVWLQLKDRKTRANVTLQDCIRSGVVNTDSEVGLYAGDPESYDTFAALFTPVIAACHPGFRAGDLQHSDLEASHFRPADPDPGAKYIVSTRIRLARNLSGHRLRPTATGGEDQDIEHKIKSAVATLAGDLAGRYRALGSLRADPNGPSPELHHIFRFGDRFQDAGGLNRNWPDGRGVFANAAQNFVIWVNEEDHLRIISIQHDADIAAVFGRLCAGMEAITRCLTFERSDRYGYISSCPTNLGTGLRVGFRLKLPRSGEGAAFKAICVRHHLTVRGIDGEHRPPSDHIYDISNTRRLGLSEVECLQECFEGTVKLVELEKSYEA